MAFLFNQVTQSLDAFQRSRISQPDTLFNSKQLSDSEPLYWDDQQISGAGTNSVFSINQSASLLSVSAATAGTRVRQTFRRFNYQSGKSHLINMTGMLGAGAAGITRRIGYFDQSNGLFFQLSGTVLSVVVRSFVTGVAVDTVVAQSAWNLDKLDGTGPSGLTLDTTKTQLFVIDFQWLGVGQVRFGFYLNGGLVYCHRFDFANSATVVYMSVPNLPLRYEISNSGAGGAASLLAICGSVMSEGGQEPGTHLATSRGDTPLITLNDNSIYPLIAIRLRPGYLTADVVPTDATVVCTSTAAYRWMILVNPTVVGVAFAFSTVINSAIEADVSRLNTTTLNAATGTQVATGYASSTASVDGTSLITPGDYHLGSTIAGVADIVVLAVQRMTTGGAAETFYGSLSWRESR